MKKLSLLVSVIVSLLIISGCEDSRSTQTQSTVVKKEVVSQYSSFKTPANKEAWPYLSQADNSIGFESDLLLKNYVVVFDDSGSMDGSKMKDAIQAVSQFFEQMPTGVNIELMTLNKGTIQPFTQNKALLTTAVQKINASGGTPLASAIQLGFNNLTKQGQRQLGYGQFGLIIVTDGEASAGENPTNIVNQLVNFTPVEIHAIGFHLGNNHVLNQKGRTHYTSASNIQSLLSAMESALAESKSFDINFSEF